MLKESRSIFERDYEVNPVPYFNFFRKYDPVHYEETVNAYFISNYEDVKFILKNDDIFTTKTLAERAEPVMKDRVLAQMSGYEHSSKKKVILKGMTGIYLEKILPMIEKRTNDIIDMYIKKKEIDLVSDFGEKFAVQSSLDLLGIDIKDAEIIRKWHNGIAKFITSFNLNEQEVKHSLDCSDKLEEYLMPLIKEKKDSKKIDLISILHGYKNGKNRINDTEILALTLNVLLAATEPVDKTLAYLFYNLLSNPSQYRDIQANHKLLKLAIKETLRFNSPVQLIPRQLSKPFTLYETKLNTDDVVICMIGAANRDPKAFINPDEFNIYRTLEENKILSSHSLNLSFGYGVHTCVGAAFSLIQLETVVSILIRRLKNIKLETMDLCQEYGHRKKRILPRFAC
ncbi:cytochrome P450, cyclodipeptide synthase-associated [Staphylococcus delphini]|uniref:Cytochrome n=1 Tax=Staphylococcus delphini TaxID=53344 RepID=A0AAX0QXF4_9STAP|nr:cytochrome P450, cyclodipeptide synthase-associated [Staphylococcus delphini]PCF51789.1 cytochrome [Staphylococcus delphini]PNZ88647.1 cytochrome P450, cyclodipeptide synthase-associated [Staphylococcus delphini]RIZ50173.1 cytochrome [Staphylococcus delphini]VED61933.1 cytochrome P450 protein [Staphylococcus delphini]